MTESTKNREQLVTMALYKLQVIGSGQDAEDEDYDRVDSYIDGLMTELAVRDVCSIGDMEQIPIEYTTGLSLLLADAAANDFGKPMMGEQARRDIEDRLQVLSRKMNMNTRRLKIDQTLQGTSVYTRNRWASGL